MTAITPMRPTPVSYHEEADTHAVSAATQPTESTTVANDAAGESFAHLAPAGGLHPVAHEPGNALFAFYFDKLRAAMNNGSSGDPIKSMGEGVAPAAKAAGKALGQAISGQ